MGRYVTVSVKIHRKVKEKLEKLSIKPSELLKKVIVEELRRREVKDLERELKGVKDILDKIPLDYIVESIREDREDG